MKLIDKLKCWFGHAWAYSGYKGIQSQPTVRACKRCKKLEHYMGHMTPYTGFWYRAEQWWTKERWDKHCKLEDENIKFVDELERKQ